MGLLWSAWIAEPVRHREEMLAARRLRLRMETVRYRESRKRSEAKREQADRKLGAEEMKAFGW